MLLPRALAAISDSKNAFERLSKVFHAPVRDGPDFVINVDQEAALVVKAASWEWEETMREKERREKEAAKKGKGKSKDNSAKDYKKGKMDEKRKLADDIEKALEQEEKPFAVKDVSFTVPRGSLVAIVGPVGCGKSSLLQGLLGEMRSVRTVFRTEKQCSTDIIDKWKCVFWRTSGLLPANRMDLEQYTSGEHNLRCSIC
jgi:ATP-binding cassette, subfamily C (CFTR/MRP), member 1